MHQALALFTKAEQTESGRVAKPTSRARPFVLCRPIRLLFKILCIQQNGRER